MLTETFLIAFSKLIRYFSIKYKAHSLVFDQ